MYKKQTFGFVGLFILLIFGLRIYVPTPKNNIVLIFDNSGSMGTAKKIQPLKKFLLDNYINNYQLKNTKIGLTEVGGNSKKGECRVDVLHPPTLDHKLVEISLNEEIEQNETGATGLGDAIRQTAKKLKDQGLSAKETTMIIATDTYFNCGEDPCKVMKDLSTEGFKFAPPIVFLLGDEKANKSFTDCPLFPPPIHIPDIENPPSIPTPPGGADNVFRLMGELLFLGVIIFFVIVKEDSDKSTLFFLLDSSASMAGEDSEGSNKFDTAKNILVVHQGRIDG